VVLDLFVFQPTQVIVLTCPYHSSNSFDFGERNQKEQVSLIYIPKIFTFSSFSGNAVLVKNIAVCNLKMALECFI